MTFRRGIRLPDGSFFTLRTPLERQIDMSRHAVVMESVKASHQKHHCFGIADDITDLLREELEEQKCEPPFKIFKYVSDETGYGAQHIDVKYYSGLNNKIYFRIEMQSTYKAPPVIINQYFVNANLK